MRKPKRLFILLIVFMADSYTVPACTIFTVTKGERVFFTGNNDYVTTDSIIWTLPGDENSRGVLFFGQPDNIQQGYNDAGLAYDSNGLPDQKILFHPGTLPSPGNYAHYPIQILKECATVEEVIRWVQKHRWHRLMWDQLHFADATGDAVVISAGPDGRVAFTRKQPGDSFLLSTNFNLADTSNGSYPCRRYDTANAMLGDLLRKGPLTAGAAASVAEAVRAESPVSHTLYTLSADLTYRKLYVYFLFQYNDPVVLDLDEEIEASTGTRTVSSLFKEEVRIRGEKKLKRVNQRPHVLMIACGLIFCAALAALSRLRGRRRTCRIRVCRTGAWAFICLAVAGFGLGLAVDILAKKVRVREGIDPVPRKSCTTVMLEKDGLVLLGDNEDAGSDHPLARRPEDATVWVCPTETSMGGLYGCIWLGWPVNGRMSGQAGMNGKGLALGLTSVPKTILDGHPERHFTQEIHGGLYYMILRTCATVDEAVRTAMNYSLFSLSYQVLVTDSWGNAAVISPGRHGDLVVTRKSFGKKFLVTSTINAATSRATGWPDSRRRLEQANGILMDAEEKDIAAFDTVEKTLDVTHREKNIHFGSYTMYSVLFDLTNRKICVYFLSDFEHPIHIDMEAEMKKGLSSRRIIDFIPEDKANIALKTYRRIQRLED